MGNARLLLHTNGIARFAFDCGTRERTRLMAISWLVWTSSRATSSRRARSSTNDQAWVWSAFDWTSGEVDWETLALEFPSRQLALQFKEVFEHVHELNIGP